MEKLDLYYVTAASGEKHIHKYAQYALRSLIKTGVDISTINCVVNSKDEKELLKKLIPTLENIFILNKNFDHIKWSQHGGKRKYSIFKSLSLRTFFPKPKENSALVYFDTDVLFYKDPAPFLQPRSFKTWFHHGKILQDVVVKRCGKKLLKEEIDIRNYKSLSCWVSEPAAWCMIKHSAKKLPDREAVAGFYLLHPRDHEALLKLTYENCLEIIDRFPAGHVDVGDQKPMNAALNILEVDWHGGSRFECPEHLEYFDHYFGVKANKVRFNNDIVRLKLRGEV